MHMFDREPVGLGSVLTANQSRLGSVLTANQSRLRSVLTANQSRLRSVLTANQSRLRSVLTANQSRLRSVLTANQSRLGSVLTANQSRLGSVLTANQSRLGSVLTANQSRLRSVLLSEIPGNFSNRSWSWVVDTTAVDDTDSEMPYFPRSTPVVAWFCLHVLFSSVLTGEAEALASHCHLRIEHRENFHSATKTPHHSWNYPCYGRTRIAECNTKDQRRKASTLLSGGR